MDLDKFKEVNEKIVDNSVLKVEKALDTKSWDKECFEVMSQAIDNLLDLSKIERHKEEKQEETTMYTLAKEDVTKVTTEFEALVYKISEKHPGKNGMIALTTVLAETMEDLRIYNPRLYDSTLRRLKEMLV